MNPVETLRFSPGLLTKPPRQLLTVETTLDHFAIVTYWVEPARLRAHLHPRFAPVCLDAGPDTRKALVSVVTFVDRDFRLAACSWPRRRFGQTNYRAYVEDRETGEQAAWFFGTVLDSPLVAVPRLAWKLPWHRGRLAFDCRFDAQAGRYASYAVTTRSAWAPAWLELEDSGTPPESLAGISSLEAGLVLLTHPLRGFFHRRDGALGSYAIWHPRAAPTVGRARSAWYPLLRRLELVETGDLGHIHSVLIQPSIDFTIYLPPARVSA